MFLNSKPEGQLFAVNWVKSVIVSVERKSCNSSFSVRRCFGSFLKSVWVGNFSECIVGISWKFQFNLFVLPFKIYSSSKCLMQRTEFFVGNQLFRLTNFIHFSIRSDFPRGKKNVETFSLLVSYPLKQPNATHLLTIFVKQKYHKNTLKFNI